MGVATEIVSHRSALPMQAYGAVAPSAALRSADERSSKSNGKSFLTILAGVVVLGGCPRRNRWRCLQRRAASPGCGLCLASWRSGLCSAAGARGEWLQGSEGNGLHRARGPTGGGPRAA